MLSRKTHTINSSKTSGQHPHPHTNKQTNTKPTTKPQTLQNWKKQPNLNYLPRSTCCQAWRFVSGRSMKSLGVGTEPPCDRVKAVATSTLSPSQQSRLPQLLTNAKFNFFLNLHKSFASLHTNSQQEQLSSTAFSSVFFFFFLKLVLFLIKPIQSTFLAA